MKLLTLISSTGAVCWLLSPRASNSTIANEARQVLFKVNEFYANLTDAEIILDNNGLCYIDQYLVGRGYT